MTLYKANSLESLINNVKYLYLESPESNNHRELKWYFANIRYILLMEQYRNKNNSNFWKELEDFFNRTTPLTGSEVIHSKEDIKVMLYFLHTIVEISLPLDFYTPEQIQGEIYDFSKVRINGL